MKDAYTESAVRTANDVELGARLWRTPGAQRAVLINAAMGVPQRFYAGFAAFLAESGFHVMTYDYRGMGHSKNAVSGPIYLHEWGEQDLNAAIATLRTQTGAEKIFLVGHSVGGQLTGIASESASVSGIVNVAVQSGYWKNWSGVKRVGIFSLWHVAIPLICHTTGRLPGLFLGQGDSVPKQVALQWARWGRTPGYIRGRHARASDANFEAITAPLRAYWIADDSYAPRRAVEAMVRWYANSPSELIGVHPEAGQRIGHFGWFRRRIGERWWRDAADWFAGL